MDYKLSKKFNIYHWIGLFVLIFIILTIIWLNLSFIYFLIVNILEAVNIDIILIINAFLLMFAIMTYFGNIFKENLFNRRFKKLLLNELFSNLLIINDNLYSIKQFEKNKKTIFTFAYISNNIFYSLINTNRITTLKIDIISNLTSFYNNDQTIREIMKKEEDFKHIIARIDQNHSSLVKNKFIEMKKLLKQLFKDFKREEDYKKWQEKGIKDWYKEKKSD